MPDRNARRKSGSETAPPSRLWNPTRTGGLLGSAFCGAAVVGDPPPPAAVVVDSPAELAWLADAVVAVLAAVVDAALLPLLSPPQAATPMSAPAARTADSNRVVLIPLPLAAAPRRLPRH